MQSGPQAAAKAQARESAEKEAGAAKGGSVQDRGRQLRETFAALANAPSRSPEQTRAAFAAAAKVVPTPTRERDYGAER